MYLNFIYNFYLNIFSSKKIFVTLILSWISIITFTYFVLPPAADDMYYFWPALNFFYENRLGMYEGENFVITYFQFPIYSIINGYFLNIYSFFDIHISSYTYKIFNKILLLSLFLLSIIWIKNNSTNSNFYLRINTFLILITFTPFSLGLIGSVRPEFLGIVLILLSLILFENARRSNFTKYLNLCSSAFFLGLAFTVHPQFFTICSVAALLILLEIYFKYKNYKAIFVYVIIFCIPIICLIFWYILGYPLSLDFLLNRANYIGESPISIAKNNFYNLIKQSLLLTDAASFTKIYQSVFTLPYFVLLLLIFPFTVFFLKKEKFFFSQKITFFIFISSLLNFTFIKTYDYYLGVIAFFLLLFFCSFIYTNIQYKEKNKIKVDKFINVFSVLIFILNSFFLIAHTSKLLISDKKYYSISKTQNSVHPYIQEDNILILTSDKLFGAFVSSFEKNYTENKIKTFMIFPFPDAGATKNQMDNASSFLKTQLMNFKTENLIFGSKKINSDIDIDKKKIVLFIEKNLNIFINFSEIIYEDKDHIFFIPQKIKIINQT